MDMKRYARQVLDEYLQLFPCVAVVGARQAGKTTLVSQLPKPWRTVDLENSNDYDVVARDPGLYLRLHPERIVFDESQMLPDLFQALRVAIDADRSRMGRFVITGSSSPELIQAISESLAGRIAIIELSPLSLGEAYEQPQSRIYSMIENRTAAEEIVANLEPEYTEQQVHDYWFRGGYPEPWKRDNTRFNTVWMRNYIQTYLERDILRIFPGLQRDRYRMFLQMLSGLSGTIINYSTVARTLGVTQPTARSYFQIADGSYLWRHIPAWAGNIHKRLIKHPKGYLRDTGLLHYMLHLRTLNDLVVHPAMGSSWEGLVIETLIRGLQAAGAEFGYSYYRTSNGAEIDFILEGSFGCIPIEIKYGQKVTMHQFRVMNEFIAINKCPYGIIINNDTHARRYNEKIIGIPATSL